LLEYSDIIWDNIPEYLRDKLKSIQIEAAGIVTGETKLCSKQNLCNDTGWETLSERRKTHNILKLHEMFHEKGPDENFLGISCEKSRFYAKKSYFFQF
jgi:hypothetical protein